MILRAFPRSSGRQRWGGGVGEICTNQQFLSLGKGGQLLRRDRASVVYNTLEKIEPICNPRGERKKRLWLISSFHASKFQDRKSKMQVRTA